MSFAVNAQHTITIDATLNNGENTLDIIQEIDFKNTSDKELTEIYLIDWANSFSNKNTPLAQRFAENFKSAFHFEKDEKRGKTTIKNISHNNLSLEWQRGTELDILKIILKKPLLPQASFTINLNYAVKVPEDKFTHFGVSPDRNYKLRYWYISPAVFDGEWQVYSNKNTDDFYLSPSDFSARISLPKSYYLYTDFTTISETENAGNKIFQLEGKQRSNAYLYFTKNTDFESVETDLIEVITDLKDDKVTSVAKAVIIDRLVHFLHNKLGPYPFEKIILSEADYKNSPVYGLNQLPDFISPFPNGFELDMELLKTLTRKYITNTLSINPREEHWLIGALQIYLMMEYVNTYYPDTKIMGKYSDFWIIKWLHASKLEFNDQYPFLYLNMARNNLHQSLSMPKDSLVKFNKNIASDYYAGYGLQYLGEYIGKENIENAVKELYTNFSLKKAKTKDFQKIIEKQTDLPVNWFFEDYISKRTTIDFKITQVNKIGDSLQVTIQNKKENSMPVSLYGLNKNKIVFKKWTPPVDSTITVIVPKENIRKLAVNYEGEIPEFNQRNNYKKVKGLFNRPLQFRLFKDIENPKYNQAFFMPIFQYNLYDGLSIGPKLYNKTLLPKGVHYKIEPQYGLRSKKIIGKGSITYTHQLDKKSHYYTRYGLSGSFFSYNEGLFYKKLTPYITFAFRDNHDLRRNKKQFINIRNVNVFRDEDPTDLEQEPNYSVLNAQYVYSDKNLINYYRGLFDFQFSDKFSKVSSQIEYRKLFNNNRQLNLRFFAGLFIANKTRESGDFFSFALDRPTDYLFDYNYYGRSEDSGLFSQQIILAEGGFKSKLEPAFANQWITTLNASTNIWKWIYAYGDIGIVKNKGFSAETVFDTGIRASLVADYFEIYFPLYSNLGWEPGLDNYDQRIRFIVTLDIKTLLGLFTREWY